MLAQLSKLWQGYGKGPVIFCVPNHDYQCCAVNLYSSYFKTNNKYEYDPKINHIKDYGNHTFEVDNDKIILIAHPCKHSFTGLLRGGNIVVPPSYFKKSNNQMFDVCFGLICFGYKLFATSVDWDKIANEKITFSDEIATEYDVMLPKVHSLFSKIYGQIYTEIEGHKLGNDLYTKIHDIYENSLLRLNKTMSDKEGRAVALLYLSDKIEFLTKL